MTSRQPTIGTAAQPGPGSVMSRAVSVVRGFGAVIQVAGAPELVGPALERLRCCAPVVDDHSSGPHPEADTLFAVQARAGDDLVFRVVRDGEVVHASADAGETVDRLVSELHLAVAVHARDALFVHAGAVSWRGRGIVVPGRSMSGKSTLVRALVEAGAEYLSDEYAVIDDDGMLHPYPKPISIRVPGQPNRMIAAATIGVVATAPVPVRLIVSTHYQPAAEWEPTTVTDARAVFPLIENTVLARHATERMLDIATLVHHDAVCVTGPRADATTTAARIRDLCDTTTGPES